MSPVDRLYTGTEPIAHPITGELIALDDREALFKAWTDAEHEIRQTRAYIKASTDAHDKDMGKQREWIGHVRRQSDRIVYALAGQDVTRTAARDFAKGD